MKKGEMGIMLIHFKYQNMIHVHFCTLNHFIYTEIPQKY